ncbi:hypothetical protein Tco_0495669 [Tanacetum coccineum]
MLERCHSTFEIWARWLEKKAHSLLPDSITNVENTVFDLGVMEPLCFGLVDQRRNEGLFAFKAPVGFVLKLDRKMACLTIHKLVRSTPDGVFCNAAAEAIVPHSKYGFQRSSYMIARVSTKSELKSRYYRNVWLKLSWQCYGGERLLFASTHFDKIVDYQSEKSIVPRLQFLTRFRGIFIAGVQKKPESKIFLAVSLHDVPRIIGGCLSLARVFHILWTVDLGCRRFAAPLVSITLNVNTLGAMSFVHVVRLRPDNFSTETLLKRTNG